MRANLHAQAPQVLTRLLLLHLVRLGAGRVDIEHAGVSLYTDNLGGLKAAPAAAAAVDARVERGELQHREVEEGAH